MKKRFQVVAIAAIAVILLSLVGYRILSGASTTNADDGTYPSIENAEDIYASAANAINNAERMALNITKSTRTAVDTELFEENSLLTYVYENLNTQKMRVSAMETVTIGTLTYTTTESYADGKGYVTVNDSKFVSDLSPEAYSARFIPAVCLDSSLYAQISGVDAGDVYIITFEKPSAAESWVADIGTGFDTAAGVAYVSHDGSLLRSVYNISYKAKNATISLSVSVEPVSLVKEITVPADASAYVPIAYLDGPKLLEKASGYLMQAQNLSANYTDSIYFQAFGDKRVESISLYSSFVETWSGLVNTQRSVTNTSREGEVSNTTETQLFAGGIYCSGKDGAALVPDANIDMQDMQNYCQERLLSTVMLPQYITQCSISQEGSTFTVHFTGSQKFAEQISANACHILYQKPELLTEMAQSSTTDNLSCYLKIDSANGLPLGAGIDYSGTFMVGQLPYQLSFKADQTYIIPDAEATEMITKAAGA